MKKKILLIIAFLFCLNSVFAVVYESPTGGSFGASSPYQGIIGGNFSLNVSISQVIIERVDVISDFSYILDENGTILSYAEYNASHEALHIVDLSTGNYYLGDSNNGSGRTQLEDNAYGGSDSGAGSWISAGFFCADGGGQSCLTGINNNGKLFDIVKATWTTQELTSYIINSTYNLVSGVDLGNQTIFRTNQSYRAFINDTTPTIVFNTSSVAICVITDSDENLTTALSGNGFLCNENSDNSTTIEHTCVTSYDLSGGNNSFYLSCGTEDGGYVDNGLLSDSGELKVFVTRNPYLFSYEFAPVSPSQNDDLTLSVVYLDDDGDDIDISIGWLKNGINIINASSGFVINGSSNNFILSSGNFTFLDNISAFISSIDDNIGYSITNYTSNVTIGGSATGSISDLSVVSFWKDSVLINWSLPNNLNSTIGRVNGSIVFNLNVSEYNFTGLNTNESYNFSFTTISDSYAENTSSVSIVQQTEQNIKPVVVVITPTDLTPTFDEDTTQLFNVTATDDDGDVWYNWFLDGVSQALTSAWNWVIGFNDEGSHNVTLVVNDTYSTETIVYWDVTVDDTFPVPSGADIYLFGTTFRNNIPVTCFEPNERNIYYDLAYSVNGGAYTELFMNRTICDYVLDIDEYEFGTNFSFRVKDRNVAGESNFTYSVNVSKAKKELFYIYIGDSPRAFIPYDVGFIANFNNNDSIYIAYAFVDCNGDKIFDYSFDYNSTNSSELYNRVNQRFKCVNAKGNVFHSVYLLFGSTSSPTDWSSVGCNAKSSDEFCYINKKYRVVVS